MNAAEKMRRHRARRKAGLTVFKIAVDAGHLADVLVDGGHLREWDAEDRDAVEAALERFVQRLGIYPSQRDR